MPTGRDNGDDSQNDKSQTDNNLVNVNPNQEIRLPGSETKRPSEGDRLPGKSEKLGDNEEAA